MFRSLGGIRSDEPGFKSFIIAPYTKTLDWVKCEHMSPYGKIVSNWKKQDGKLTMRVTVLATTTATVHIPGQKCHRGRGAGSRSPRGHVPPTG